MVFKPPIRYLDYVCDPQSMKIEAEFPLGSLYLFINVKVSNKIAFEGQYSMRPANDKKEIDDKVILFCNAMLMFTEDEIYDYVDGSRIMPALYAYRNLKEVKNRGGGLVWKRPKN